MAYPALHAAAMFTRAAISKLCERSASCAIPADCVIDGSTAELESITVTRADPTPVVPTKFVTLNVTVYSPAARYCAGTVARLLVSW